jgi:hypothetical protein
MLSRIQALLVLNAMLILSGVGVPQTKAEEGQNTDQLIPTTVCEVLRNQKTFHGKRIRIRGVVTSAPTDPKRVWLIDRNCVGGLPVVWYAYATEGQSYRSLRRYMENGHSAKATLTGKFDAFDGGGYIGGIMTESVSHVAPESSK